MKDYAEHAVVFKLKKSCSIALLYIKKLIVWYKRTPHMGRQAAKKQQDVLTTLSGNDLAERTTEDDNALGHVLDYIQNIERQGR